jgi:carbonic anhydrase
MKIPFKFKDVHNCEAVVLTCIDFRFWRETLEFVEKELNLSTFDFPSLPGSAKAVNECAGDEELAMQCIGVPCNLHHAKKIVIVNHEDCGAYGGSKKFETRGEEQAFHESELKKAKERILKNFPDKEVILIYAKLDEEKENVEFLTVV